MGDDRELLIRAVTGEIDDLERARLEERLAQDPTLGAERGRLQALGSLLAAGAETSFQPFFAARVMRRLQLPSGNGSMYEAMRWAFARVAVGALVACASIGLFNAIDGSGRETTGSALESALGLPAENLETAFLLASEASE